MDRDYSEFGARLREARKRCAWTQSDLAERSHVDRATISLIENGHEAPRADTVLRLAEALNLSPADFWSAGPSSSNDQNGWSEQSSPREPKLHPGLETVLTDETMGLMLKVTQEEERMLRSIRARSGVPLTPSFFVDVLVAYRKHRDQGEPSE